MKKIKFTLLAFLAFTIGNQAFAQDLGFGVKAGANYNTITANNSDASGIGFHAGALMDLGLSDALNFRVEALVSARTLSNSFEALGIKTTNTLTPMYLTVPVLYNYKSSDKLSFFAGPQMSFIMSNKASVKVGDLDPVTSEGTDGIRSPELGLAAGAEYNISDNLFAGLRYVRGL